MTIDKIVLNVASDKPKTLNVTSLQLIGVFPKVFKSSSGFFILLLTPISHSKLSLKIFCSIPTWYIEIIVPKTNNKRIRNKIIFFHLLVKIKKEPNIIAPI